jgi:hypothetical protein
MKRTRIVIILFLLPFSLFANDFGLVANVNGGFGNADTGENRFDFRTDLWPSDSKLVGDNGEFTVSAGLTFGVEEEFFFIPELLKTEFSMRFGTSGIRAGRITYSDPLTFIADGLFDGLQFFYNSGIGNFSVGAWYTGFLYKKNANVTMTADDLNSYEKSVDYGDFSGTYFAPRRAFASIGWQHPSLGELIDLNTAIIGQMDFSGAQTQYHSQYLIIKAGLPVKNFLIELGGSLAFSQTVAAKNESNISFATDLGFSWLIPGDFISRLSFTWKYASGETGGFLSSFIPITTKYYGFIFEDKISGLSIFTLDYSARFHQTMGASLSASYFVRNGLAFKNYPVSTNSDGNLLGPEISARLIWNPFSDLQLNFGGGAFLPSLGNAGQDEPTRWKVDLTATMTLY